MGGKEGFKENFTSKRGVFVQDVKKERERRKENRLLRSNKTGLSKIK